MKFYTLSLLCLLTAGCTKSSDNSPAKMNSGTPPAAPATQPVAANSVTSSGFTATWRKVSNADKYLIYVASDDQFTQPLANYNPATIADTSIAINNLSANTTYYYRIKASVNGLTSNYSNIVQQTTLSKQWIVSTFAGNFSNVGGYADGQGTAAKFNFPDGITIDGSDNLYVNEFNRIRKITPTGLVSTLTGGSVSGTVDGTAATAKISAIGITYDARSGNLFIGDMNCIRKVDMLGNVITVAGNPAIAGVVDGQGGAARIYGVDCLTADPAGNIYFYELGNNTGIKEAFRKLAPTGAVTTIPLSTSLNSFAKGGIVYYNNNIYVGNAFGFNVLQISLTGAVSVFTGLPSVSGSYQDGPISVARFGYVAAIAVDYAGNFYVADQGFGLLREISNSGNVSTFAGIYGGYGNAIGPALTSTMNSIKGIVVDSKGNLFLLDNYNNCVREISYQ